MYMHVAAYEHTDKLVSKLTSMCAFSAHSQQTAPSVCVLSIEGARCGVLCLAGHRQSLCKCQASLASSNLIAIISMMRLIF